MAEDIGSLVRVMNGYKDDRSVRNEGRDGRSTALITRDLLGCGLLKNESQELDLDLQVPNGWEKRLDLKSGKMFLQRCNSAKSTSSSSSSDYKKHHHHHHHTNQTVSKLQDLNFPPSPSKLPLNLFDDGSLELKLLSSSPTKSSSSSRNSFYQSVCTLDKVKSALERAEKVEPNKKRSSLFKSSASPSYSSSSSSIRETLEEDVHDEKLVSSSSPIAAGCHGCLSYVLIMKSNPKCPRCNSVVPMPSLKKPKIDLNISI
ncbi:hypothetical protein HS088_TW21G00338 [Tripterygium wilfordii]|uniref:Uncharacterized protein n=1 Tax=Tripterygium wilfordii TaxID=458696 RepID=A0A7J7C244_TRIWF|nr:uncharacterized protein LOC119989645 [Tripterygium wilfordii]KAF5728193.1 hypothetical protein HS088_TW21G00338 [Tripterygium wilfordii]